MRGQAAAGRHATHPYTAHLVGPDGIARRLDIQAEDLAHARQLARDQGVALFGRRGYRYIVRAAALPAAALLALGGCAAQPLVYPDPAEGVACSPATDSVAQQIGSPHRTCRPGQQAGGQ